MTSPAQPTSHFDRLVDELVTEYHTGPEQSGLADSTMLHGVRVTYAASRGWGVQLSRDDGQQVARLCGDEVTSENVTDALNKLLGR